MRKVLSAVIILTLLFVSLSNSQNIRDGKWWQGLDKNAKIYFVAGFWGGVIWDQDVMLNATLSNLQKENVIDQDAINAILQTLNSYTDIGSTTVGEIVDRIDNLYSDPQNQTVVINDMMTIVVLKIQGLSNDVVQQLLQGYRQRR